MFGYLLPLRKELKVGEYDLYRAYYCGLCRACPSPLGRLTLSYDTVLLALLRTAVSGEEVRAVRVRCPLHPLRGRCAAKGGSALSYSAAVGCLLSALKMRDDIRDEGGLHRLLAPFASELTRRSALPELEARLTPLLDALWELEASDKPSPDALADAFGALLGEAFCFGYEGLTADAVRALGVSLGRWVYLTDAIDDRARDLKKGRFTPFPSPPDPGPLALTLSLHVRDAQRAWEALFPDEGAECAILRNILFLGLPAKAEEVLQKSRHEAEETK